MVTMVFNQHKTNINVHKKNQEPAKIKENEVRITTGGRVKNYVDYATRLFEGTTDNREQKTNDDNNNNAENTDKTDDNADKTDDNNNNAENTSKGPSKKFDSIVLKATGKAINKAVTTAEIVKRTIGDLHQETNVETLEIVDVWEPKEEGLQKVETTRRVASISIKLSRKAELVDVNAPGYQKPIPKETGFNMGMPFDRRDNRGPMRGPRNNRGPRNDRRDNRNNRGNNRGNRNFNRGPGGYAGRGRGRRGGPRGFRGGPRGGPRGPRNNYRGGGGNNYPYRGQGGPGGFNNNRGPMGSPNRNNNRYDGGGRRGGPRRGGRGGGPRYGGY